MELPMNGSLSLLDFTVRMNKCSSGFSFSGAREEGYFAAFKISNQNPKDVFSRNEVTKPEGKNDAQPKNKEKPK